VIRATAISMIDQALLSAVNLLLAVLLIRFATQEEYGLYSQLIGLQSLFSVLHAGLFVSAYLALLPHQGGPARLEYQAGMARAEFLVTVVSMVLVTIVTWSVSAGLGHSIGIGASAAAALGLLGLWWREFARARCFAEADAWRVLRLDLGYASLLAAALAVVFLSGSWSAATALWCMGLAGVAIAALPLWRQASLALPSRSSLATTVRGSWKHARWEVMTSLTTWGHAQTYVFFAALQGGLIAAAEISAARLLTAPLALAWISYANILRPQASRLLTAPDAAAALRRLALRSVAFVFTSSAVYALALWLAMPLLTDLLFAGQFPRVSGMVYLWLGYFALTGLTTIATSLLRSVFEFQSLFRVHLLCAAVAAIALCAGLGVQDPSAFVLALLLVEGLLAALCWWLLHSRLRGGVVADIALTGARGT
jgi:O-antigen/teichoic acid export membrane protein